MLSQFLYFILFSFIYKIEIKFLSNSHEIISKKSNAKFIIDRRKLFDQQLISCFDDHL